MTNSRLNETSERQRQPSHRVRNRVFMVGAILAIWQLILAPGIVWVTATTSGHPVAFTPWTMYELESSGLYHGPTHIGGVVLPAQLVSLFIIALTGMVAWAIIAVNRELAQTRAPKQT